MHKVIDDFLDKEDFIFVHNLIMNEPFPWFYMDSYRESGLEKDKRIRGSLVDLAKSKMEEADSEEQETEPEEEMVEVDKEEKAGGLMSRGM